MPIKILGFLKENMYLHLGIMMTHSTEKSLLNQLGEM